MLGIWKQLIWVVVAHSLSWGFSGNILIADIWRLDWGWRIHFPDGRVSDPTEASTSFMTESWKWSSVTYIASYWFHKLTLFCVEGECTRMWIPGGRDHWGPSWRLAIHSKYIIVSSLKIQKLRLRMFKYSVQGHITIKLWNKILDLVRLIPKPVLFSTMQCFLVNCFSKSYPLLLN